MATKKDKMGGVTGAEKTTGNQEEVKSTAFSLRSEEIERFLATGENAGILEDYFGPDVYHEMQQLALKASTRTHDQS
jgi:hypothetical protein